jgi:hypothetical protein
MERSPHGQQLLDRVRIGLELRGDVDALTTLNDARTGPWKYYYCPKNCKRRAFVRSEV